ncbi:MAG: hypothetical protein A2W19_17405 [Spirochaetes bacterium RBG_16_49_21]|nr:MAG: hypothetical protein A2W19_17405 [Spirochaetes bacterium RBG_16_49_21]
MKNRLTIATVLIALSFAYCTDKRIIPESKIQSLYKNSRYLNDTAAFLAGIDPRPGSSLYPVTRNQEYGLYSKQIDGIWEQYRTHNLMKIEEWRKANMPDTGSGAVLYPFSGPDILNALAFFPDADRFIMIGLELPGNIPDPLHYKGSVYAGLWGMKNALRTILQLNLFRTSEMMADFRSDSYSNITGIMMFFLARYGYDILDVRRIHIGRSGMIAYEPSKPAHREAEGVEFLFRKKKGSPVQTACFISADLSDGSLSRLRGFAAFLSTQKNFITFTKSASYLLGYNNFTILRSFLLAGSRCIIQEDSGIPFKYFSASEWKISLYGTYRVIAIFSNRFQRALDAAMKIKSAGPLPFSLGYGFVPEKSNLMVAEKIYRSTN